MNLLFRFEFLKYTPRFIAILESNPQVAAAKGKWYFHWLFHSCVLKSPIFSIKQLKTTIFYCELRNSPCLTHNLPSILSYSLSPLSLFLSSLPLQALGTIRFLLLHERTHHASFAGFLSNGSCGTLVLFCSLQRRFHFV